MSSNKHLRQKAISLRKKGYSYNNIRKVLKVRSKGTISYWFKNLILSDKSQKLLCANNELAHKRGLFLANKNRKLRIEKENNEAKMHGRNTINQISENELLLLGTALYWAEGTKSEKSGNVSLSFSNSDPAMIAVYLRFVREILKIPEDRIRAGIHIYPSILPDKAKMFWSKVTKLPIGRFYIVTQVSRASKSKRPSNSLPHGTAVIKINNRIQFYKVKGMICGIIDSLT